MYLNKTATIVQTNISMKNIFKAFQFKEIPSKIVLFWKNMRGAINKVIIIQKMGKTNVGLSMSNTKNQKTK
jgi:hypothetical protein